MKNIIIFTLTLLTIHLDIYSQEVQNFYGSEKSFDLIEIDPVLIDEFVELFKENDIDKVYNMVADEIKLIRSKENIKSYREMYERYFGKILRYEQTDFRMSTNEYLGQFVNVSYNIEFERYLGKALGIFLIIDTATVKMHTFDISMNKFFSVEKRDSIAKPILNAIIEKDKKKAYDLTSSIFKENNSISEFKRRINEIFKIDIVDYKMYGYKFGIKEDKESLDIYYVINEKGYLQLFFTKRSENFELDGINYKKNLY